MPHPAVDEKNPERVLAIIKEHIRSKQRVFVGVIGMLNPEVEESELVRDRILSNIELPANYGEQRL